MTETPDTETGDSDTADRGLGIALVTIASPEAAEPDDAGDAVVAAARDEGHTIVRRERIDKAYDDVQAMLTRFVDNEDVDVIVTVGGTGIEPEDVTIEAVEPLLDKQLPAFRDLFNQLSYDELGTSVIISRALGGVVDGVPVFCLPNNSAAAGIAAESIIVKEADLLVDLAAVNEPDADNAAVADTDDATVTDADDAAVPDTNGTAESADPTDEG